MRSNLSFLLLLGLLLPLGGAHAQTVPAIDPSLDTPIDLIFEEPASVLDIYRALGQAWGINFLFDPKLRDQEISIVLRDVSPSEGLDNVLRAVGHFYSVVDAKTLLIADDTPQNRRTHEHQVIQRFYLENSAVKDTMTMVRSLIGAKHVAAMEATNSIVIRDTADKIGIVERLLQNNDRPQAEVVVELDLLAIDSQKLRQLALKPAAEAAGAEDGLPPRLRAGEIDRLRSQASVHRLAQPRLNIVGGSRGKVQLTDRLPLPASLADARAEGVGAVVYHEVGVELAVEPWVHSADEVSLKLELGIDTLTDWLTGSQGEAQPVFGRR
ncbi:MAG: secretin N-terminal domain-containing protein, partial [Acidobacteriota bacterium]